MSAPAKAMIADGASEILLSVASVRDRAGTGLGQDWDRAGTGLGHDWDMTGTGPSRAVSAS